MNTQSDFSEYFEPMPAEHYPLYLAALNAIISYHLERVQQRCWQKNIEWE